MGQRDVSNAVSTILLSYMGTREYFVTRGKIAVFAPF
jgi:hypothetical protein